MFSWKTGYFLPCLLSARVLAACSVISSVQNAYFFLKLNLSWVFCFVLFQLNLLVELTRDSEIVICHLSVFSAMKSAVAECLNVLGSWYSQYFNIFSTYIHSVASGSYKPAALK